MSEERKPRPYDKRGWRRCAALQLRIQPLCEICLADHRITSATLADHIIPHRGDMHLFWTGKLQSLCGHCHSSIKAKREQRGFSDEIGVDGWPLDPNHPTYRVRG